MKHICGWIVAVLCWGLSAGSVSGGTVAGETVVIPLKGNVSNAQFLFVRRALKEAERSGAGAVVFEMNTYGGELAAAVKMQEAFFRTTLPTYTFINPNAGSAGALIAVSTTQIYMAPVSAIGAAAPVMQGGEDVPATMSDKIVSYFSGYFRSAAERNGHSPDIAEAFINKEKEVKIGEVVIHSKGSVLTLGAQEATKLYDGKPLLAKGVVPDVAELARLEKLNPQIRYMEPTGFEQVAFLLTAIAPLLLLGGIAGAYIEFKSPGFGLPGIASLICFGLFFASNYIAGLAGWEVVILFGLGFALVVSELILHPGTIVPGLIGVALVVGALLFAMVDRYPAQPLLPTAGMLLTPALNLSVAILGTGVIGVLFARYFPQTSFYRRVVLSAANPAGPSIAAESLFHRLAPGTTGEALSALRPSGRARFGENVVDVVTEGEFVESGTAVRIVAIEGSRVIVEA